MFGINLKNEHGGALLSTLFVLLIIGMIAMSAVTMIVADSKNEILAAEERQAFYAAQSGLEYGIKRVMISDETNLSNWSETIPTGNGTVCTVTAQFINDSTVTIQAVGKTTRFVKRLQKTINFIDVSRYAIYARGRVRYTLTNTWPRIFSHNPGLIRQNAPVMPIFDLDELRNLARPNRYYRNNLVIRWFFTFSPRRITFVEKNLRFSAWSWGTFGHFVVMGNVTQQSGWIPFVPISATVYQPVAGKVFRKSGWAPFFYGGIITNGDVIGGNRWTFFYLRNLHVFHNRNTIRRFMDYSINGGSLLIHRSRWENLN